MPAQVVGPWSATAAMYRFRALLDANNPRDEFRGELDSEEWALKLVSLTNKTNIYLSGIFEEVGSVKTLTNREAPQSQNF